MKNKLLIILIVILSNLVFAQQIDNLLIEILKNNQELKAITAMNDLEVLNAKNELLPENPEFGQEFQTDNNYEIGITQSFQFPTYYYHQYKNLQLTKAQQKAIYIAVKIQILEDAKINLYRLQYLVNQIKIISGRLENATKLSLSFKKMLQEGEANQLELNQVKIHQIAFENQLQDLLVEKAAVEETLKLLNGGQEVTSISVDYSVNELDMATLKAEYFHKNPELSIEQINEQLADRNTKIAKYGWFPGFSVGVHKEKESDLMLHYGISIPLWKNRNHVNRAKANQKYNKANYLQTQQSIEIQFNQLSSQYSILLKKLNLSLNLNLNSYELLEKSLSVGEISIIEYYTELENLYDFEDDLAKTQLDLEIVKIKLTSYRML